MSYESSIPRTRTGPIAWMMAMLAALLIAGPASASAQSATPEEARSTQKGVYTAQQASRGRTVYATMCSACHTSASHSGTPFISRWGGRALAELYALISQTMPQTDPGSLSRQEYTDLLAYLLQLNRMPPGGSELPADSAALRRIRIDTTAAGGGK